jgi:hypothetical protein
MLLPASGLEAILPDSAALPTRHQRTGHSVLGEIPLGNVAVMPLASHR